MGAFTIIDGDGDSIGPTGAAINFVTEGWDFFEDKAILFSNKTLSLIDQLSYVPQVVPTSFSVNFPSLTALTGFTAPARPTLDPISFDSTIVVPAPPDNPLPAVPAFTNAPAFDVAPPPAIVLPAQPGNLNVPAPGAAPALTTLVLPDAPAMVLPDLPAFLDVAIPEAPTLVFADFAGTDPGAAPTMPNLAGVGFTEQAYTPTLLAPMTTAIRTALSTGQLLDAPVEQALFQRARERLGRVSRQARQAVDEAFSSRGFKQPPGSWAAAHQELIQKQQDDSNDTSRELFVTKYQEAVKNVQFAIVQGIALEQVLIGQHNAIMDRSLQGARLLLDVHLGLFNAQVAGYNAAIERFKADAMVYRERLQAEVAKVEAFKAQVDGQRAVAEINKALADTYDSQVRALVQVIEVYKAQIAGVQAQAELERTKIESYRAEVGAYGERVKAHQVAWDGFTAAVNAQQAGFKNYEIGVQAYGARVNAYGIAEQAKSNRYDTQMKGAQLGLEAYKSRIQGVLAQLQREEGRVRALIAQSESQTRLYQTDGQIEQFRADANTRAMQVQLSHNETRANIQLREAEVKIQDAQRLLTAQVEAIRGAANAMAQLAASAMSAVNFSAGVSGSGSESTGYSYSLSKGRSWSWQGETADSAADVF